MIITVQCPSCTTSFPVDTDKVPSGGVNARCSVCASVFRVERPVVAEAPSETIAAEETPEAPAAVEDVPERESVAEEPTTPEEEPAMAEATAEPVTEEADVPSVEAQPLAEAEEEPREATWEIADEVPDLPEVTEPATSGEPLDPDSEGPTDGPDWDLGVTLDEADTEDSDDLADADWMVELTADEVTFEVDEKLGGPDSGAVGAEVPEETTALTPDEPATIDEIQVEEQPGAVDMPEVVEEEPAMAGEAQTPEPESVTAPAEPPSAFQFGKRDPHEKAQRLARVLVSDMIMYNPERHDRALAGGTLREDFDDEIQKSWDEYIEQVGEEIARGTTYFKDALNDILARGEGVFDDLPAG